MNQLCNKCVIEQTALYPSLWLAEMWLSVCFRARLTSFLKKARAKLSSQSFKTTLWLFFVESHPHPPPLSRGIDSDSFPLLPNFPALNPISFLSKTRDGERVRVCQGRKRSFPLLPPTNPPHARTETAVIMFHQRYQGWTQCAESRFHSLNSPWGGSGRDVMLATALESVGNNEDGVSECVCVQCVCACRVMCIIHEIMWQEGMRMSGKQGSTQSNLFSFFLVCRAT